MTTTLALTSSPRNGHADDQYAVVAGSIASLQREFVSPPATATPGVYWYFMDGNFSREGVTRDLESMKEAGIGRVVFLEVNVGVPKGDVKFLSPEWLEQFAFTESECRRLGIEITLGVGPGWAGSGGPWVKPEDSMLHLVGSVTTVTAQQQGPIKLAVPAPRDPYFGADGLTPEFRKQWENYYKDELVIAYPTPSSAIALPDRDEKALYYREPYTSKPGVKPYLEQNTKAADPASGVAVARDQILNLTGKMNSEGLLDWRPESGEWTVLRFGQRNNGAITRPAPDPGLGMEADKLSTAALAKHLESFTAKIFQQCGINETTSSSIKMLHIDSWEMGAQNWTQGMRDEFKKRRGYDPLPYLPAYLGTVVESQEITERFLWDLRLTCQEMVLENHADALKNYGRKFGMGLSIEPYDMNPSADLALGSRADIPMCEFWSAGYGFDSAFSCVEATSLAHVKGRRYVQAEAFTGDPGENWNQYPGSMKNQGDWAFALGVNRFFYHTFAHQPLPENLAPGMTMGPYGVHWDRKQTWWPMASEYHRYIARCQHVLQHGRAVSDILFVTAEGAPHVFLPPPSALAGGGVLPDKRGYGFDGCDPGDLLAARVEDGKVVFPGGGTYRIVVLPLVREMTPELLGKVKSLLEQGATVVGGVRPERAPGLVNYPKCDADVKSLVQQLWGDAESTGESVEQVTGKGRLISGKAFAERDGKSLFPAYGPVAELLRKQLPEDFTSTAPLRYHHRILQDGDLYFVSNTTDQSMTAECAFRCDQGTPELWDSLTGRVQAVAQSSKDGGVTKLTLQFFPHSSWFVVFRNGGPGESAGSQLPQVQERAKLEGSWDVSFDPAWGGPEKVQFSELMDWTKHPEDGIRYYSGTATYRKDFEFKSADGKDGAPLYLDLGAVKHLARVRLNGKDLGILWTSPWRVDISREVRVGANQLEVTVVNLWPNRLIGDQKLPSDGIEKHQWPEWIKTGDRPKTGRFAWTTYNPYKPDSPLLSSGLMGPVTLHW